MKAILILLAVLASFGLGRADAQSTGNALDQLGQKLSGNGVSIIKSYTIDQKYQRVDIKLQPSLWDLMTSSQQLRLCDAMATTGFLTQMNLLYADLYVDSTKIGSIQHNWTGGISFSKEDRYWNP